ncbi:MAG: peptidoglycan-binding domain-containing protein [Firmicutes bacterium]|nr:peptidoglycan-binding domain-containing protein [Bacillota bacterium]
MANATAGILVTGVLGLGIAYLLYREYKQHSNEETPPEGAQTYTMNPSSSTPSATPTSSPSSKSGVASGNPTHVIHYHNATGANGVPKYYFSACPTLKVGDRGPMVAALQKSLAYLGFNPASTNGVFGDSTADAVLRFQSYMGLSQTGIAGKETFKKLNAILNGRGGGYWTCVSFIADTTTTSESGTGSVNRRAVQQNAEGGKNGYPLVWII